MATAPQAAMEMPQQGANPYEDPNTMAIYDQMRQSMSPKEFGDELLAGASQVDPQAMAQFKDELSQIDLSPEELDSLNNMVDEVIASPEQYDALREKYLKMGMPEELLPEQFDGQFFAALNMAIDQLIAEPAGVQAFAKGGIAELKPIAKTIASYGRNGDTMLAHITPAEARMLRRRGGSGTINPATGLPEFFLKKAFKKLGKAVKSFASSTVGKLVTTVALGFFLGPAAASMLSVSSAAGVAAVSGFVGSAGSTLLGGGNLSQALKAGAIGGLTAGAGAGIMGGSEAFASGSYTGPTTISGQYDRLMGTPAAPAAPTGPAISQTGQVANMAPNPADATQFEGSLAKASAPTSSSFMDTAKDFYDNKLFPSDIQKGALPNAQAAANAAVEAQSKILPASITGEARSALLKNTYDSALKAAMPGILSTYGPITAAGIGAIGAFGGFEAKDAEASKLKPELLKSATDRIAEKGKQKEYYVQNLPGVKYDEFGAPIYGQYNPLPTAPASTTPTSNFDLPNTIGGIGSLYTPPSGTMGTQQPIAQPYNTASMYTNLMPPPPPRYAEGGDVTPSAESAAMIDAQRAAMIAQAQALGQTGYTPTNPGSYGVERGSYTPSTGFAEFTQQYMRNNPAPVARASTTASTPTSAPVSPAPTGGTSTAAPTVAATSAPTTIIDYAQQQLDDNYLSRINPVQPPVDNFQTSIDNLQTSMGGYQPPMDNFQTTMDNFQTSVGGYQPPIDNFQTSMGGYQPPMDNFQTSMGGYQPPADISQPPMDNFQTSVGGYQPPADISQPPMDNFQTSMGGYQPPADISQPPMDNFQTSMGGYQPPMETFQPPMETFQPPMDNFQTSVGSYQPPMETFQPPMETFQPPMDNFQTSVGSYQPPMETFQPMAAASQPAINTYQPTYQEPAYQAPTYEAPSYAPTVYDYAGLNTGGGGGPLQDSYSPFGESDLNNDFMQSSFNAGGIASLRSGGYPRRTGQISGPGTATSDSIPAMLSDGEFVMTAKAVRGAGKGDRRAGAKRMYALMHQLEQNAARG
jgi:hypothetical protein